MHKINAKNMLKICRYAKNMLKICRYYAKKMLDFLK
jgi:hypothetical protein